MAKNLETRDARARRIVRTRAACGFDAYGPFADALGEDRSAWGKVERGQRPISLRQLEKLVEATGVTADYILFGDANGLSFDFRSRLLERDDLSR